MTFSPPDLESTEETDRYTARDPHVLSLTAVVKVFKAPSGYEVPALGPVDLNISNGEFVAIVGPSGCGKSTLLRVAAGLMPATHGEIGRAHHGASFVFQEPALLPWRTIERNCGLPLELAGMSRAERSNRVSKTLELVGLSDWARFYPHQLSGGMKMRASLARALVPDAALIFFDEPFSATDELSRARLNDYLSSLWVARKFAALFVTHSIEEAVFLAQRVLIMSERPGTFCGEVMVPFEFPRDPSIRTSDEFVHVERKVVSLLNDDRVSRSPMIGEAPSDHEHE